MTAKNDMRSATLEDLRKMAEAGDIRPTPDDAPTFDVPEEFWDKAEPLRQRRAKKPVSLRVDQDVLEWFKSQGEGHLTRMNAVLRSFYEAHQER